MLQGIMSKEQLKYLVLASDFDLPSIKWENNVTSSLPQYMQDVSQVALVLYNDLFLIVMKEPTRGRNIHDLFFALPWPGQFSSC